MYGFSYFERVDVLTAMGLPPICIHLANAYEHSSSTYSLVIQLQGINHHKGSHYWR